MKLLPVGPRDVDELFRSLEDLLVARGAALVACGDLAPVPELAREGLPRGISIGVALEPTIVAGIAAGPTPEYARHYDQLNRLLAELASFCAAFLVRAGYRAVALAPTVQSLDPRRLATPLPHKTVATRAGVGWIGKSALLVTERFGSAVRYNSVLTDAPLPVGVPVEAARCGQCDACVKACPAGAATGRLWQPELHRGDFFDAFACCRVALQHAQNPRIGRTICGVCIAACPYTNRYLAKQGIEVDNRA